MMPVVSGVALSFARNGAIGRSLRRKVFGMVSLHAGKCAMRYNTGFGSAMK